MANAQFDERNVQVRSGNVVAAGGTTEFQLLAAPSGLTARIDTIYFSNSDTIPHEVALIYDDGAGDEAAVGGVSVPAGAGFSAPAIEAISTLLPTTQPFLIVVNANPLFGKLAVAMGGASKLGYSVTFGYI